MPFAATWMNQQIIILSEVSQTEKDKYHLVSYVESKRKKIQKNLFIKQKQTHRHRKQTWLPKGKNRGGWGLN